MNTYIIKTHLPYIEAEQIRQLNREEISMIYDKNANDLNMPNTVYFIVSDQTLFSQVCSILDEKQYPYSLIS